MNIFVYLNATAIHFQLGAWASRPGLTAQANLDCLHDLDQEAVLLLPLLWVLSDMLV
jgi:hypothetical protein